MSIRIACIWRSEGAFLFQRTARGCCSLLVVRAFVHSSPTPPPTPPPLSCRPRIESQWNYPVGRHKGGDGRWSPIFLFLEVRVALTALMKEFITVQCCKVWRRMKEEVSWTGSKERWEWCRGNNKEWGREREREICFEACKHICMQLRLPSSIFRDEEGGVEMHPKQTSTVRFILNCINCQRHNHPPSWLAALTWRPQNSSLFCSLHSW